jgi:hypothetical protein
MENLTTLFNNITEQDIIERKGPFRCLHRFAIDFGKGDNFGSYNGVGESHRVGYTYVEPLSGDVNVEIAVFFYGDGMVWMGVGCVYSIGGKKIIKTIKYSGIYTCNSEEGADGYIKNFKFNEVVVDKDELHQTPNASTSDIPLDLGDFPEGVNISNMSLEEFKNKMKNSFNLI